MDILYEYYEDVASGNEIRSVVLAGRRFSVSANHLKTWGLVLFNVKFSDCVVGKYYYMEVFILP